MAATRPPFPRIPLTIADNIPDSLKKIPRWLNWSYRWDPKKNGTGGYTKPPKRLAKSHRNDDEWVWVDTPVTAPISWSEFQAAQTRSNNSRFDLDGSPSLRYGVGIALTEDVGLVGIDIDHCRDAVTGELTELALDLITILNTYTEISPSGTGIRMFLWAKKPGHRCRDEKLGLEVYEWGRYLTVTGNRLPGSPVEVEARQAEFDRLAAKYFPEPERPQKNDDGDATWTPSAPPTPNLSLSDQEIIDRARNSKAGQRFDDLWNGNWNGRYKSVSNADFALAGILAFWCGPDEGRIINLMRQSGLARVQGKKYFREDYLPRTVRKVLAGRSNFYSSEKPDSEWDKEIADLREAKIEFIPRAAPAAPAIQASTCTVSPIPAQGGDGASLSPALPPLPLSPAQCEWEEAAAAEMIRDARRDVARFPCYHCRRLVLEHLDARDPWLFEVRCEKRGECEGCTGYLNERELLSAASHFGKAEQLFQVRCDIASWPVMHKRINRLRGEFLRIRDGEQGEQWVIFTDVAVPDAIEIGPGEAFEQLRQLLAVCPYSTRRPVSTSHGWRLPRDETSRNFRRIGKGNQHLNPERLIEIADDVEATLIPRTLRGQGRVFRVWQFVRPGGWTGDLRHRVYGHLFAGEVLPDFDIPPPTSELPRGSASIDLTPSPCLA